MNIVFLDFDGVINTPNAYDVNKSFRDIPNQPNDGKVNNYNAIQLLNKLCKEYKLSIVVTCKNWRNKKEKDEKGEYILRAYKRILYNSGLDDYVYIYGNTPATDFNKDMEIKIFLEKHKEIEKFIILEDCKDEISRELQDFMVLCNKEKGFTRKEYEQAIKLLKNQPEIKRGNSYNENQAWQIVMLDFFRLNSLYMNIEIS